VNGLCFASWPFTFTFGIPVLKASKLDSPQVPEQAEGVNALSNSSESFAGSRERHLNAQQSTSLRIRLEQFASQNFWIVAETGVDAPESEHMKFGQQLRIALLSAGWIESQHILQRMGSAGFRRTKMAPYSMGCRSEVPWNRTIL
jgi:hypothetical protein